MSGFKRPWAFWLGVAGVTGGVALHVPMYLSARDDHYMLSGMPWDRWMILGMALMAAGYAAVVYGLAPSFRRGEDAGTRLALRGLDDARLTRAHLKLMVALTFAVAIDTQKPFTFTFILPGVADEYNLRSPSHPAPGHWPVALFPFVAIVGTVVGSLIWGRLGDAIGRRASILLASTLFIGTAMCSAMPAFHWNLVACFFMGAAAGGLLPIAYALLTETIPARRRGEAVVLVAGIGTALGFLLASWTAHWLIPTYSWRIMWFFGIPTGLGLILLNHWIPESPRYLFARGRGEEARRVMRAFGVAIDEQPAGSEPAPPARAGLAAVFLPPYARITPVLTLYGFAWGLVNFGFIVWLPIYVSRLGVSAGQVTTVLAKAALFAVPGSVAVAALYGRWSARGTLVLAAALEAGALGAFALRGPQIVHHTNLFTALLVVLLVALWATISALAPYAAEVYPTAIRGAGSGVAAGATKLGGVLALGMSVLSWSPPGIAGAALLAAVPAAVAAALLLLVGVETRGRSLEEIAREERKPRTRYPVILPSWQDPRLHVSFTFVWLYVLGQLEFHFRLSIPQMLTPFLTAGVIEVVQEFRRKKAFIWPASALLTGNGIAFIMRIPGTRHGDWWTFRGTWIYAAVAAVAMLSKYLITWRGKHVFNPSNLALVACFLILGSGRAEPLQFWWGPISPALLVVLGVIVAADLLILRRVGQLGVATLFWVTFTAGTGILALSGHAFSANWHLGPVADGYFWKVLVTSPEVFIFLSFMITDPRTTPETVWGRRVYAVTIGLLSTLLIAPMQTEFAAKVALLATLTIVCAARPVLILARERWGAAPRLPRRRPVLAGLAAFGAAAFAGLVVAAGSPARSVPGLSGPGMANGVQVTVARTVGVVSLDRATARFAAAAAIGHLPARERTAVSAVVLRLKPAVGQDPPTVVATVRTGAATRVLDLALDRGSFTLVDGNAKPSVVVANGPAPKGTGAFSQVRLTNVASKVGLDFHQDAFRHSMSDDPQAMMGGGLCFLDYDGDGWLDLYAVNSYTDSDQGYWDDHGGLPQSELFHNLHGRFANVTKGSGAGLRVKGNGCVAADLNGDGRADLVVTTATGIDLLWNDGHGRFTQGAAAAGIRPPYAWYSSASVADVNGDGRPDLFVAGYTNLLERIQTSIAGFPTNYRGVRDLLYLNEGHGRFKEVGAEAGLESKGFRHGLGSAFTDVNGDGRPDLYVANDADLNYLYVNVKGGPLGFHFVDEASQYGVMNHNAGMGVAVGDDNGDGAPDLFVTNSRGQPHAAYESKLVHGEVTYTPEAGKFEQALQRKATVGWGDAFVDLDNSTTPDLILANGNVPVLNVKRDTEPMQVLQDLGGARFTNASGVIAGAGMPKIIGRGLAVADYDNDGRMDVAVNSIDGPLVLLRNTGPKANWLEVSLAGFHPGATVTATLPDGHRLVDELQAGGSYLSSGDPRAHFGLGAATHVALTVRYPGGRIVHRASVPANRILTLG
ncbi:MAG TPA: MFS transporter [Gaiellaceae bacterium]|nr:MFS transporter [Gaiellaceae bacterium]